MTATVLVVASDAATREAVSEALEPTLETVPAEGGLDALKRIRSRSVDCVVAEVGLPDVPPVGFVEMVHGVEPELPVVLLSRTDEPELAAQVLRAGAHELVQSTDDIVRHVERAVTERRATTTLDDHEELVRALRDVSVAVLDASTRVDIERALYDRLMAGNLYRSVWIGEYAAEDRELAVRVPVEATFDSSVVGRPVDGGSERILERAASTRTVQVADGSVGQGDPTEGAVGGDGTPSTSTWRSAVVPFAYGGTVHGAAIVSTARVSAFDTAERELLSELGDVVGFALWRHEREDADEVAAFATNVIHELRNPLGIAMAHLDIGREDDDPEAFEHVEAALQKIEHLVENVSSMARLDGVDGTVARDLDATVAAAWDGLDAPEAEYVIEDSAAVVADHDLLEHLFSNLFRNAVKHAGADATVRIGTTEDGFYVEDDGPGIPAAERDRVFERGFTSDGSGLGIGLSLVRDIVDAHGWSVAVEEGGSGGARFEITGVEIEADVDLDAGRQTSG